MSKKYDFSDFEESKSGYDFSDFDGPKPEVSQLESGARGLAQGASLGFADEITGAIEALSDVALTDKQLSDLKDLYLKNRDESRSNYKKSQEANPVTYGAGEIGGSIATALVPGLNVAKGATLATKVGVNAALGGAAGLGLSEADNVVDIAKDTATGAALSGGLTYGIEKAAPLIKKGIQSLASKSEGFSDEVAKKVGKTLFGVDEKATQNYLANPERVNKAYSLGELGDSVLNLSDENSAINEMKKKASDLSSEAWQTLNPKNSIHKYDILQAIDDGQNNLLINGNVIGKSQERAYNALGDLSKQIINLPADVDEPTLKELILMLDENINWNNPEMGPTNDAFKQLRTFIDTRLKNQNNLYKTAMEKTEDITKATKEVQNVFQNRMNPASFDKFNKSVKNLVNKDELSTANQAVNKIKEHTGYDLKQDIVDAWTKAQLEKGATNGSRNTLMGGITGSAAGSILGPMGSTIGSVAGGATGHTIDNYAGPIFKKLLDGKISAQQFASRFQNTKFSNVINNAASRGNKSLAATHFLLTQQNPEYRKLVQEQDDK